MWQLGRPVAACWALALALCLVLSDPESLDADCSGCKDLSDDPQSSNTAWGTVHANFTRFDGYCLTAPWFDCHAVPCRPHIIIWATVHQNGLSSIVMHGSAQGTVFQPVPNQAYMLHAGNLEVPCGSAMGFAFILDVVTGAPNWDTHALGHVHLDASCSPCVFSLGGL